MLAGESTLTPRYVRWLIEWLPDTAAIYASAQGGPHHRGWNTDRHVAVSIFETLRRANYQRGGNKGPEPKDIKRPKVGTRTRRTVTVAELNGQG